MNLNYTLLNTIIKYPVSSVEIDKDSGDIRTKKMGYYYAEQDIFKEITKSTGAVGCRHPLAFILETLPTRLPTSRMLRKRASSLISSFLTS